MQLGTPITIISGGINAVKTVISNCNNPRTPRAHITPVITTLKVINVALNDLKKKKNMQIVTQNSYYYKLTYLVHNILSIHSSNVGHTRNPNI